MVRLILMTDFTEAFAHYLLQGLYKYAATHGEWIVCRMPPAYKDRFGISGVIQWAKNWKADAIIGQFDISEDVSLFKEHGIIALAQDYKSRFSEIANITADYFSTGAKAADFFISRKFRHFAFFGYKDVVWSDERFLGFSHRIKDSLGTVCHEYRRQDIAELWYYDANSIKEWLDSLPKPVAVFCCDDNQGTKLIEVCNSTGHKVPDEVAVLGVDNDVTLCQMSFPPLSSIAMDVEQGGYDSAALIDAMLHGEDRTGRNVVIQPLNIVSRTSTNIIATEDVQIREVVQFIHENISKKINVSDVLALVPMSRKLLEIRFRKAMGSSIYQYIVKTKMDQFLDYLVNTDIPVSEAAGLIGETDPNNVFRRFKSLYHCTPQQYRQKQITQNESD